MADQKIFKTIDPKLYQFDDERVKLLASGEMTELEFMRVTAFDDPWEVRQNGLVVVTEDEIKQRVQQYKDARRKGLEETGGLRGATVLENKEQFLEVYPEIKEELDKAVTEIEAENCKGCAANSKMQPVVKKIVTLPAKGRKLDKLPPKLPEMVMTKLQGKKVKVTDDDMKLPPHIQKKTIPLLPDGKSHEIVETEASKQPPDTKALFEEFKGKPKPEKPVDVGNIAGGPRPTCLKCTRKHISNAIAQLIETPLGYPTHKWLAVGELGQAEAECVTDQPDLANKIRQERLLLMDTNQIPNLIKYFEYIDGLEGVKTEAPTAMSIMENAPLITGVTPPAQQKLILSNGQAPGDILMMTAAVRDLKIAYGDRYLIDVRTPAAEIWDNNPYITKIDDNDPDAKKIKMEYPIIHQSNEGAYHFVHGFRLFLEEQLDIKIPQTKFWGDIHFTEEEKSWMSMIQEHHTKEDTPFWLICTGGKTDYSAKWWIPEYAQKVVDHFKHKIQFVQFGATGSNHVHPELDGVINLVGKTDLRQFMRLMYHADGVVCPITFAMHLAAAMPQKPGKPKCKACVVTAGGREPSNFTEYTNHQFLHTNGCMPCCDNGGCWKSRTEVIDDGDDHKNGELCVAPVKYKGRMVQKCMHDGVTANDVIRAIKKYYINGNLKFLNEKKSK